MTDAEWDYFDLDGAVFRRPAGGWGPVTDVFDDKAKTWRPYKGDRTKPAVWGDVTSDPMAEAPPEGV